MGTPAAAVTRSLPDLHGFTGSEDFFQHALNRRVIYTEGAQHVAETCGAYWLLDEIAIAQAHVRAVRGQDFQVWKLQVTESTATLSVEDGNDNTIYSKHIPFTDFPAPGITLWCVKGDGRHTILLPSEY